MPKTFKVIFLFVKLFNNYLHRRLVVEINLKFLHYLLRYLHTNKTFWCIMLTFGFLIYLRWNVFYTILIIICRELRCENIGSYIMMWNNICPYKKKCMENFPNKDKNLYIGRYFVKILTRLPNARFVFFFFWEYRIIVRYFMRKIFNFYIMFIITICNIEGWWWQHSI